MSLQSTEEMRVNSGGTFGKVLQPLLQRVGQVLGNVTASFCPFSVAIQT